MIRHTPRNRPIGPLRSYLLAALLNLALVSTVLRADERPPAAQVRIVTNGQRFCDTELVRLGDGTAGVASLPYQVRETGARIGHN